MTVNTDQTTRLLDVLRAATGLSGLAYEREPVALTGGFWAELLAFSLAEPPPGWPADLVARVMPDAALARKETIVQSAVSAAGYPTPAVRASGGPDDGLGRAFMIMDLAGGAPLMPGLNGPSALAAGLRQLARIPEALASAMAALHALDPQPVRDQLASLCGAPPGDDVPPGDGVLPGVGVPPGDGVLLGVGVPPGDGVLPGVGMPPGDGVLLGVGVRPGDGVPVTLGGMLAYLQGTAALCQRDDLASAARWLIDHPRPPQPDVICHGDLHPFNALVAGGQVTVLDWSASLLAPRAYDVAFTVSMLAEPPLDLPGPLRTLARGAGRLAARRFVRRYQAHAAVSVGRDDLRWHRAVISLRSLTEVAGWVHDGTIAERGDHPWLTTGSALAAHLTSVTGVPVRPQ